MALLGYNVYGNAGQKETRTMIASLVYKKASRQKDNADYYFLGSHHPSFNFCSKTWTSSIQPTEH
jgi:hypothetical protein